MEALSERMKVHSLVAVLQTQCVETSGDSRFLSEAT